VVYVRSNAFNQRDENVLTWARWVMVHRRKADAPNEHNAPQGQVDFAASVAMEAIRSQTITNAVTTLIAATGSRVIWDDIEATGKSLIRHPAGMTIEESDHMLATRLYQNTARVHFDLHHMKDSRFGKRLIYGGHVLSICRALAYDGLENVISIAAIEGGSHTNPTFAGDTLYATSHFLSKWPVNDSVGAVRVRLCGYKNVDPRSSAVTGLDQVLSLDYVALMPRRGKG
jgi:2-methylfumaryl-CoA hydratase